MSYPMFFRGHRRIIARWLGAERARTSRGTARAGRVVEILSRYKTVLSINSREEARMLLHSASATYHQLPHAQTRRSLHRLCTLIARACGIEEEQRRLTRRDRVDELQLRLRAALGDDNVERIAERLCDLEECGRLALDPGALLKSVPEADRARYLHQAEQLVLPLQDIGYVPVERVFLADAVMVLAGKLPPIGGPLLPLR